MQFNSAKDSIMSSYFSLMKKQDQEDLAIKFERHQL